MGFKLHSWFRRCRNRAEKSTGMVLTVTEDTPADMLTGSMELLVQLPMDHHVPTQRVTVERSTAMMDLLVQIATAHKLAASSYTLQAIGERGLVLPHQPNTPIGALDALQVKLLPKQGTFIPRKTKQANQPFETTFRLQVHLPRNQLYVSRVSPKMNLGEILEEVCREKNLDRNKYELRHPGNHEETLDLSLSLQDYHLQEVTLYAKQGPSLGSALSSQDIMALQRQEERRRVHAKQSVFGFMFRKSKESSVSTDSLGGRSVSPAHSDETGRSVSPLAPPTRPQRKRRPAPNPPVSGALQNNNNETSKDDNKDKLVISHSRNSSDSSGYHEASVLSDNPDSAGRMPETLPRRNKAPGKFETRKLAHTSQTSKSLSNLAVTSASLSHATSNTSLSSTGVRKKRAAPQPPIGRPLSSAISTQALERIVDSEESLTSDMGISKPPSDIEANSKANSDIAVGIRSLETSDDFYKKSEVQMEKKLPETKMETELSENKQSQISEQVDAPEKTVEPARVAKRVDESPPIPKPRKILPKVPQRRVIPVESSASISRVDSVSEQTPTGAHPELNNTITESFEPTMSDTEKSSSVKNHESNIKNSPTNRDEGNPEGIDAKENSFSINENQSEIPLNINEKVSEEFSEQDEINMPISDESDKSEKIPQNIKVDENNEEIIFKVFGDSLQCEESDADLDEQDASDGSSSTTSRHSCTVISTIPKCCHLKSSRTEKNHEIDRVNSNDEDEEKLVEKVQKKLNKSKVFRSQSAFSNFDVKGILERNNRGKNSHPDNFNCALNPNFSVGNKKENNDGHEKLDINYENMSEINGNETPKLEQYPPFITHSTNLGLRMDLAQFTGRDEENTIGIGKADEESPSATDILLQKVSTTLATVLPSSEVQESSPTAQAVQKIEKTQLETEEIETTPNQTLNSQQDTSDYVSATGEDLSGTDWEYQLPDPPSAFRDDASPDVFGYETITLGSVDAFKDPIAIIDRSENPRTPPQSPKLPSKSKLEEKSRGTKAELQSIPDVIKTQKIESTIENNERMNSEKLLNSQVSRENRYSLDLKKDIISELETKIENGSFSSNNKFSDDAKRIVNKSTPKIAPVDNTLANFTITTYSTDKSLNIYDNSNDNRSIFPEASEERVVKTFATLSRSRSSIPHKESFSRLTEVKNGTKLENRITRAQSVQNIDCHDEELKKPNSKPAEKFNVPLRSQNSHNDHKSSIVHRSKSYIVLSNNSKYREEKRPLPDVVDDGRIYKSTSYTNLNQETPKNDELQSVQVLKSILPQLKNAQLSSEKKSDKIIQEKPIIETKTYKYTGPPAISLGSWSERPCVNVQIKHDTDYKFGVNNNKIGGKTVVNLNSTSNEVEIVNYNDSITKTQPKNTKNIKSSDDNEDKKYGRSIFKNQLKTNFEIEENRETNFNNKLRNNYMKFHNLNDKVDDKPVITEVSLKKSENINDDDVKIDTRPVNFKELAQAFGEVNLRNKSKKNFQNRHSDYFDSRNNNESKKNEPIKSLINDGNRPIKRYTSVIGINSQTINGFNSESKKLNTVGSKLNMPVVKGFKSQIKECQTELNSFNSANSVQNKFKVPTPPTMPVITGVTLKNTNVRPKSMAVCKDPRDQLLESIRNFGRDKLRSVSTLS